MAGIRTDEQANAKLAELVEADPEPEATCSFGTREPERSGDELR